MNPLEWGLKKTWSSQVYVIPFVLRFDISWPKWGIWIWSLRNSSFTGKASTTFLLHTDSHTVDNVSNTDSHRLPGWYLKPKRVRTTLKELSTQEHLFTVIISVEMCLFRVEAQQHPFFCICSCVHSVIKVCLHVFNSSSQKLWWR